MVWQWNVTGFLFKKPGEGWDMMSNWHRQSWAQVFICGPVRGPSWLVNFLEQQRDIAKLLSMVEIKVLSFTHTWFGGGTKIHRDWSIPRRIVGCDRIVIWDRGCRVFMFLDGLCFSMYFDEWVGSEVGRTFWRKMEYRWNLCCYLWLDKKFSGVGGAS